MNYLGHFYLAAQTNTSITGAWLGDFVKGSDWQAYQQDIATGIRLHRFVDAWIDQQFAEKGLLALFGGSPLRRYAAIGLDIYIDYLLANSWSENLEPLEHFAQHCYRELAKHPMPFAAEEKAQMMTHYDWLPSYRNQDNIYRALQGVKQRLRRPFDVDGLWQALLANHQQIDDFYQQLLPSMLDEAQLFLEKNNL